MNIVLNLLLTALCVLQAISLSYAQEVQVENPAWEEALIDHQEEQAQNRNWLIASADYINVAGERFSISGDGKAGDSKQSAAISLKNDTDKSSGPNMNIYNLPPLFMNNISYDFSGDGLKRTARHAYLDGPLSITDFINAGAAFLTNLAAHEFGHEIVANYVGAEGSKLNFFSKSGGDFFLGTSSVEKIDDKSVLPYTVGGEVFADLTFEHALRSYRHNPNSYNKSLLVVSGADFAWYCFYSFYVSADNPAYDPITISKETGLSRDALFSLALTKTLINAYRVYSGSDILVPYFKVDNKSASLNFIIPIDIGG